MGDVSPKRKARPMLTFIPEEVRAINFRFEFAIVGEDATAFANLAVHSEMAEAFKPKAKKNEAQVMDVLHEEDHDHEGHGHEDHGAEEEEDPRPSPSDLNRGDTRKDTEQNVLTMFCPIGSMGNQKELARVRFLTVEKFSDDLPISRANKEVALNTAVVFLFWTENVADKTPDDSIKEWASRMAEINHTPKAFRPYCTILAYGADAEQEAQLRSFAETQPQMNLSVQPDSSEDTVVESLHEVADELIKFGADARRRLSYTSAEGRTAAMLGNSVKGKCCVIL